MKPIFVVLLPNSLFKKQQIFSFAYSLFSGFCSSFGYSKQSRKLVTSIGNQENAKQRAGNYRSGRHATNFPH